MNNEVQGVSLNEADANVLIKVLRRNCIPYSVVRIGHDFRVSYQSGKDLHTLN